MNDTSMGGLETEELQEIGEKVTTIEEAKQKRRPFHFWHVGDKSYRLKLKASGIGALEDKYRKSILSLATDDGMPPLSVMLTIVFVAMRDWEHGTDYDNVSEIFDHWVESCNGNQLDFYTKVLMPTLAVSGFFTEVQARNILANMEKIDDAL